VTERAHTIWCDYVDPEHVTFSAADGSVAIVITNGRKTIVMVPGSSIFGSAVLVTKQTFDDVLSDAVASANAVTAKFRVVPAVLHPENGTRIISKFPSWPWSTPIAWSLLKHMSANGEKQTQMPDIATRVVAPSMPALLEGLVPCKRARITPHGVTFEAPVWSSLPGCAVTWMISTGRQSTSKWGVVLRLPVSVKICFEYAAPGYGQLKRLLYELLALKVQSLKYLLSTELRRFVDTSNPLYPLLASVPAPDNSAGNRRPEEMRGFYNWFDTLGVSVKAFSASKLAERRANFQRDLTRQFKFRTGPYRFPKCLDHSRRDRGDNCMRCTANPHQKQHVCKASFDSTPLSVWIDTEAVPLCLQAFDGARDKAGFGGDRARLDAAVLITRFYAYLENSGGETKRRKLE